MKALFVHHYRDTALIWQFYHLWRSYFLIYQNAFNEMWNVLEFFRALVAIGTPRRNQFPKCFPNIPSTLFLNEPHSWHTNQSNNMYVTFSKLLFQGFARRNSLCQGEMRTHTFILILAIHFCVLCSCYHCNI